MKQETFDKLQSRCEDKTKIDETIFTSIIEKSSKKHRGIFPKLDYLWDGTGTGETNIADGVYYYYISAITNGESNVVVSIPPSTNNPTPPSPEFSMEFASTSLYAVDTNTESVVPLSIYPPGFNTNDLTIISATPSEVVSLQDASDKSESTSLVSGGIHPDEFGVSGTPPPSSQNAPQSPQRPPNKPNKGNYGTYGICYQRWINNDVYTRSPTTGWPYLSGEPYYVALDGLAVNNGYMSFQTIMANKGIADDFDEVMKQLRICFMLTN